MPILSMMFVFIHALCMTKTGLMIGKRFMFKGFSYESKLCLPKQYI